MFAARLPKVFRRPTNKTTARKRSRTRQLSRFEFLEERRVLTAMYDVQWLGALSPTDNFSSAQGINDQGQIVGDSYVSASSGIPSQEKAFSWTAGGGMVDLGTLNGNAAYAWDVNNSGAITGWYHYPVSSPGTTAGGGYYEWAFVDQNGAMSTIPGYAQIGLHSVAYGVNDNNIVVGHADVPGGAGTGEAFTYDGTTLHFLGTLGGKWSYGMDINSSNVVAGFADTGQNPTTQPGVYVSRYHAVLWTNGVIQDLGTLGTDSYAYKVNDQGMAVGSSITTAGEYHPFLYDGAKMIDLVGLGGNGEALSINNQGQIVGDSGNWLNSTAFLYENGALYDLNSLVNAPQAGDQLMRANDINNLGQIVGYGMHNGRYEAFLLTPGATSTAATPATPTTTAAPSAGLAAPDIVLTGGTFTYDGSTHSATATAFRADGVTPLAGGFTITYNGSSALPSNAGTYDVVAAFTSSDPSYTDATVSGTLTITPAAPTVNLVGGTFIYDGAAHAAHASAVEVDGATAAPGAITITYDGSATPPSAAGTYAVVAAFASSDSNYADASATVSLTIDKATPAFNGLSSPAITAGTASATVSGQLTAGSAAPVGDSVTITVNGVSQTAAVDASGNFSASFATGAWPAGSYAVAYVFAGNANFNAAADGNSTLVVNAAAGTPGKHDDTPDSDAGRHRRHGDGVSDSRPHTEDSGDEASAATSGSSGHADERLAKAIAQAHDDLHATDRSETAPGAMLRTTAREKAAVHDQLMAEWDS